ncbi:MAG: bifunctional UDP-3-O-[3-hydroxymyristoyl] N-acetylglucosamine deacetylase/3-hydroxyacyl-ACP dehydratase [Saprospiraceae bacterium]|nr:bifunctional UDP-3-O-[3-hydroxymyristoyl] N-acetylglucosamine deacetylase/3-hydroxyacyl-ACP dehydratase [Saprospiraceae bacterium]
MKQKTISQKFEIEGIGLHTGETVKLSCHPAEPGTGIKFKRTDIDGQPVIDAYIMNVDSTYRSTCLQKNGVYIYTIEHLLSAFYGLEIDNVLVELDGPEIPILSGSSKPYVDKIIECGIVEQDEERSFIEFKEAMEFTDPQSGSEYLYLPPVEGQDFEITSMIEYQSKVGRQVAVFNPDVSYADDIAPSRTFVFVNELEELYERGVIKGGRVDNAIVFSHDDFPKEKVKELATKFNVQEEVVIDNGILNGLELFYPNEPARHKLLDLLGDLYLLRKPIRGRIFAKRPGHTGNVAFTRFIRDAHQKNIKLKNKPVFKLNQEILYNVEDIKRLIPHRFPFLLVEKIIELSDNHVVGLKNVSINEAFFQGHFPGNPVFPGVLQMEALAQTGGILALSNVEEPEKWDTYFLKMDNVKFKKIVYPGDTLILKMELLTPIRRGIVHMQGTAYVGDSIVSEGELTAQIIKRD